MQRRWEHWQARLGRGGSLRRACRVGWKGEPALRVTSSPNGGDGVREARVCGYSLKAPKCLYVSMVTAWDQDLSLEGKKRDKDIGSRGNDTSLWGELRPFRRAGVTSHCTPGLDSTPNTDCHSSGAWGPSPKGWPNNSQVRPLLRGWCQVWMSHYAVLVFLSLSFRWQVSDSR